MTFTYDGADDSVIIKSITKINDVYTLEYFNGDTSTYYCNNVDELKKLKQIMLNQAKERQKAYDLDNLSLLNNLYLSSNVIFSLLTAVNLNKQNYKVFFGYGFALLLVFGIKLHRVNNKVLKELKKYKLFFEMEKDLSIINNSNFLKCVEFDNLYQIPVDIETIDLYTYGEIKTIYKEYKKLKNESKK